MDRTGCSLLDRAVTLLNRLGPLFNLVESALICDVALGVIEEQVLWSCAPFLPDAVGDWKANLASILWSGSSGSIHLQEERAVDNVALLEDDGLVSFDVSLSSHRMIRLH